LKNQGFVGQRNGIQTSARDYIQQKVALEQWKKVQKEKGELGVRTLEDMSEEEIEQLEAAYGCPVKRPDVRRRRTSTYTIEATLADQGGGWIARLKGKSDSARWGESADEAMDKVQVEFVA
jgi:hypothetical protein